nr:isopentenyl-diphosphate Delta-isomerase [Beutenbergia cavernae]
MATDDDVVLLDATGAPSGSAPRSAVHGAATPLHLAFSCHVQDAAGRVLVTRRALGKRTWPGVWTNAVCGHPRPGERVGDAVVRRAREELGAHLGGLRLVLPEFRYRAVDASGVVENEVCPVYVARLEGDLRPDPAEVMEVTWAEPTELGEAIRLAPWAFSPWLVLQARELELLGGRVDVGASAGGRS